MHDTTGGILRDGLFAGLIGYLTVVVLFATANVFAGHSIFHTAAMLGSALFFGLDDPAALIVTPAPVLAYNMVHVLVFLGLGMLMALLVSIAERFPVARYGLLFALIFVAAHLYGAMLLFALPLLPHASWQIGFATVAAAVAMGWFLIARHPALRHSFTTVPMGEE